MEDTDDCEDQSPDHAGDVSDDNPELPDTASESLIATYPDIVDEPQKLIAAEARVTGRSVDEWRQKIAWTLTEWLGPWGGWILIGLAVLLWLWISYTR